MSVTIDSLDIQIRSSAGSAATNIEELAKALGELKKNGSLGVVTKNLSALADSVEKLKNASTGVGAISSLATAVGSLSKIQKASGLNSIFNTLKKLPEVMSGLDDSAISSLADKMEKLSNALSPLADKIDRISTGFSKLPSRVSKTVTAVNKMDSASRKATSSQKAHNESLERGLSLFTLFENIQNYMGMLHGVRDVLTQYISDAIEWDGIQFRFGRAFGEDAEEVYQYVQKVSDALKINTQMFMQYSSLYGSLLSGFGMAQDKVTTISVGLTELSYDIWAAYNDRYKTLEEASEAVRSAITGEIEPIRNAGIALTEASLQEYIDSTHLAGVSIETLTEAQKAEVRYAAMVNAAMNQGIVGTYAAEMTTAEGAVRTLAQQMKTLGQSIGSLFIPILQAVIPWISAFVEILTDAIKVVAEFFGIPFFEIDWGNSAGMGGLAAGAEDAEGALGGAAKAAKKLKDYTMGFDELNVISPTANAAGGAGGAGVGGSGWGSGLELDTLWDDSILGKASEQIDELKGKIKDYMEEHKLLLSVVGGTVAFLGFMKILRGLNSLFGVTKTIAALSTAFGWLSKSAGGLKSAFGDVKAFFSLLKGGNGLGATLAAAFPGAANIAATAKEWVTKTLFPGITKAIKGLPKLLMNAVKAIPGWGWVIGAIVSVLTLAIVDFDFTDIGYKLGNALGTALKKVAEALAAFDEWITGVRDVVVEALGKAWEWVKEEFDINSPLEAILLMINPVALVAKVLPKLIEIGAEVLPGIWQGIKDGWNNFWGNIGEFIDGFIQGWKDALGIHSPSTVFAEIGTNLIAGLLNGITEKWEELKRWFNTEIAPKFTLSFWKNKFDTLKRAVMVKLGEVKSSIVRKWNDIKKWYGTAIAPKLTLTYWLDQFSNFKSGFVQTIKNMLNAGIDLFNKFIGWLNDKLGFSWEAVEIMGKEVIPAGSVQLFTIPLITQRFEDGGFIEDGLFTMNYGEIAGKFSNGRSVVANNQQIVEGVAAGVYQAVVQAMSETQRGDQAVNVYLDGKQITAAVERHQSERGRTIMGNQLGYAY